MLRPYLKSTVTIRHKYMHDVLIIEIVDYTISCRNKTITGINTQLVYKRPERSQHCERVVHPSQAFVH